MNSIIKRLFEKLESSQDEDKIFSLFEQLGWENIGDGVYKTVYSKRGWDIVIKVLNTEYAAQGGEGYKIRELGTDSRYDKFRPKTHALVFCGDYAIMAQERVKTTWHAKNISKSRKHIRRTKDKIYEIFRADTEVCTDLHDGNFGLNKFGKIVVFDGI